MLVCLKSFNYAPAQHSGEAKTVLMWLKIECAKIGHGTGLAIYWKNVVYERLVDIGVFTKQAECLILHSGLTGLKRCLKWRVASGDYKK